MPQGNVGIRLSIDAAQARSQVQELSSSIADLVRQMNEAREAGDWGSVARFSQAIDSASSGRGQIMAQARQAEAQQPQLQARDGFFGGKGMAVLQQSLHQITDGILSAWDAALTAAKQRASGDYAGAAVSDKRAKDEAWGQGIGSAIGMLGFLGGPILGMITMGIGGQIGKFIAGIDAKKMEENLAWSAQYKNALPSIDSLNQLYGGAINRKTAEENNRSGLAMHERSSIAARGTGLDTDQFIGLLGTTASYGVKGFDQALNTARQHALWSRFTGTDIGAIQKFGGQAQRFGGDANAVSTAYGSLMAQNMGKGQFSEMLNAMGRILEDGIAKGFVRSAGEIAGNMNMLYKLSGGSPLWQGEQGAQRLNQMNSAVSSATALQSVEDVITYSAASGYWNKAKEGKNFALAQEAEYAPGKKIMHTGTHADEMQLMEKGVSAELLKGQWDLVRKYDGDNAFATISRFKEMYGLNYTGASQVWAMYHNAWEEGKWEDGKWKEGHWKEGFDSEKFEKEIKDYQKKPGYQSDSQKLQDILNSIKNDGIKIGKIEFDNTEIPTIKNAAVKIHNLLYRKFNELPQDTLASEIIDVLPPEGGLVDMQEAMADDLDRRDENFSWNPRDFWESLNERSPTAREFLETDQQARAYIDMAAQEKGEPVERILDIVMNDRFINFSDNFEEWLLSAKHGDEQYRYAGIIDPLEYNQAIKDLVDTLERYNVSTDAIAGVYEKMLDAGIEVSGTLYD